MSGVEIPSCKLCGGQGKTDASCGEVAVKCVKCGAGTGHKVNIGVAVKEWRILMGDEK